MKIYDEKTPVKSTSDKTILPYELILSNLQQSFEIIDKTIYTYSLSKPIEKEVPSKIENFIDLLEIIQNLLGTTYDEEEQIPKFTLKRIEQLQFVLKKYGVEVVTYKTIDKFKENVEINNLFTFENSIDEKIKNH